MHNLDKHLHHLNNEEGKFLGFSLTSGEPVITNFSLIDREVLISKDNILSFGDEKNKESITSINDLRKIIVKLLFTWEKSITNNKVYIDSKEEHFVKSCNNGFCFETPTFTDYFIYQLMFDVLYDKFLHESPKLTLNQYCEKRCHDFQETPNNLNKLMAAQIELEFGKENEYGEWKKGIYNNTELIRDAEEFGFNFVKYIEKFRSQNKSYTGKRNIKTSEYKPRRECEWDYLFYNGKSGLITTKQFRRVLERDSNYSYSSFVEEFNTYDRLVQGLFMQKEKDDKDYFSKSMGFYHLEIYKRLDFTYKLAVDMEHKGMLEIDKDHPLIRRFYPHVYCPFVNEDKLQIIKKRKYYRPPLLIERKWMNCIDTYNGKYTQIECYKNHLIRAIVYELFRYNFNFVSLDYKDISDFICKHYNILSYHEFNKVWNHEESSKLNLVRITNVQKINRALFDTTNKRPKIKKGRKL